MSTSKSYKWCVVAQCKNNAKNTPSKLFFYVPLDEKIRNKWLEVAGRHPTNFSSKSKIHMCEDHFDLPNDMENYMEYKIMGSVLKIKTKAGSVPSKFECQRNKRKQLPDTTEEGSTNTELNFISDNVPSGSLVIFMNPAELEPKPLNSASQNDAFLKNKVEDNETELYEKERASGDLTLKIEDEGEFTSISSRLEDEERIREPVKELKVDYDETDSSNFDLHHELILKTEEEEDEDYLAYGELMLKYQEENELEGFGLKNEIKTEAGTSEIDDLHSELILKEEIQDEEKCMEEDQNEYFDEERKTVLPHITIKRHFQCVYCEFETTKSIDLKEHLSRHSEDETFCCKMCEYTSRLDNLKKHLTNQHAQIKIILCQYCAYHATKSGHLKKHVSSRHIKKTVYQCHYCDYETLKLGHLKYHVNSRHTKETLFSCPYCIHKATLSSHLKRHINSRHTKETLYACPHCAYKATRSSYLKNHINSQHTNETVFLCPHCDYKATQTSTLKNHINSRHMKETFVLNSK